MAPDFEEQRKAKEEQIQESLKLLASHEPFLVFVQRLREMRELAIREATWKETVANPSTAAQLLGAIGTYNDILDEVEEARKTLDSKNS